MKIQVVVQMRATRSAWIRHCLLSDDCSKLRREKVRATQNAVYAGVAEEKSQHEKIRREQGNDDAILWVSVKCIARGAIRGEIC